MHSPGIISRQTANSAPLGANTCSNHSPTQLDVGKLDSLVQHYYKSAQERFFKFCPDGAFTQLQVTKSLLCTYVSYLVDHNLKHGTTKVYVSAFWNLQIASSQTDLFAGVAWPRLDQVMRGTKRVEVEETKGQHLPISPLTPPKKGQVQHKDDTGCILLMLLHISPGSGNDSAKRRGL